MSRSIRPFCWPVFIVCLIASLTVDAGAQRAGRRKAHPPPATAVVLGASSELDPLLKLPMLKAPGASQWPNSDYATLLDLGEVTVKPDGTVVSEMREVHKLFNERAREMAEVDLPYNASYQSVQVLRARTIKKNGAVLTVKPSDIRKSTTYSDFPMYDDAVSVGFSMPGIEDDCVIDYTYRITTKPFHLKGHFWQHWTFTGRGPVSVSRWVVHHPAAMKISAKIYNGAKVRHAAMSSSSAGTVTESWTMADIPPIVLESNMPPPPEIGAWMEITSIPSWQEVSRWFWDLARPQVASDPAIRGTVARLILSKKTDEEKARAIYDWVANQVRYVALEFGLSAFKPHPAAEVHMKLYGDCKDKATLLISMLGLAGIKAYPVLLDSESQVKVRDQLPTLNSFDHCIALAEIGGREVWLDPTAETCAYGDIPESDRGADALVIRDGAGQFQSIPSYRPEENGDEYHMEITLRRDGGADIKTRMRMIGSSSQAMRAAVRSTTPDQRKQMVQGIAQGISGGAALREFRLPDEKEKTGPFNMDVSLNVPRWTKKAGSLLILPISNGALSSSRNPYTQEKRAWPVVIDEPSVRRGETVISLPSDCTVEELPDDVHLTGPSGEFTRTIRKSDDGRSITISTASLLRAGRIPASDFPKLKAYYADMLRSFDDPIVVRRH